MAKISHGPSSVERVIQHILAGIRDGFYAPGQRLVIPELADKIGVSRGPVREAIFALAGANVIEVIPNRGAVIRDLSAEDIAQMYQFLEIVHGGVMSLAATRIHEKDNALRLKEAMRRVRESIDGGQPLPLMRALAHYHLVLTDIAGNVVIKEAMGRLYLEPYQKALASRMRITHWNLFVSRFQEITNAILAGNGEEARAAFTQHMEKVISLLRQSGEEFVF